MMHVISLGAGVQSTTLYLMAAAGEITPMPKWAIFADTQWEPQRVYNHLQWLKSLKLPIPILEISRGNIRENLLASRTITGQRKRFATVPWFIRNADGSQGIGRRQCTKEFKIEILQKKQRELLGYKPRQRIPKNSMTVWIGISLDEIMRVNPSRNAWITNRWPLIEKRMHRSDCLLWLERHGYPQPPKSSCIGCPFHSNAHWREMRDNAPDEWMEAVEMDREIRNAFKMKGQQFMHRDMVPLDQVDLSTEEDRGQLDMFNNECMGLCNT